MTESSKALVRRLEEGWFKYLNGKIIDIGAGGDPVVPQARVWELDPDGDAQYMAGVEDESFDTVYSSHCLEHLADPSEALRNWWRILKPGGCLWVIVPDEDLYEQGIWPSRFNSDHKTTWTVHKDTSWSPVSRNLYDELLALPGASFIKITKESSGYDHTLRGKYWGLAEITKIQGTNADLKMTSAEPIDQSKEDDVEVSIEAIVRKNA